MEDINIDKIKYITWFEGEKKGKGTLLLISKKLIVYFFISNKIWKIAI